MVPLSGGAGFGEAISLLVGWLLGCNPRLVIEASRCHLLKGSMKAIAIVAVIALAVANTACTTTGKRVGGAAVGGVFGAAVAGPIGAAAGAAAGAATAPSFVR